MDDGHHHEVKEFTSDKEQDPKKEARDKWGSPVEFVLAGLGYAVGLGNIWRFPYVCFNSGGGAFLLPYALMLFLLGLPISLMETSVGQFSAAGPIKVWSVSPLFKGLGFGQVFIAAGGNVINNIILGWTLYYMYCTCQKALPWQTCGHSFNSPDCYSKTDAEACELGNGTWYNMTCYNETALSTECTDGDSCSPTVLTNITTNRVSASEEFFMRHVLDASETIETGGQLKPHLLLAMLVSATMCCLCVIRGVKSVGKVVYVTALFPYILLLVLLVRGATLPGARRGIEFFLIPRWELLAQPQVWANAVSQLFYSIGISLGAFQTFASYNKFSNNIYRDTFLIVLGNSLTSIFAGFVIFSILGFMAHTLEKDVSQVVTSGSGLAFVAYPEVVTQLPLAHMWAMLFFLMLIFVGMDSQFAGIEVIMTALGDSFPYLRPKKALLAISVSAVVLIIGIPLSTRSGVYWLELIMTYNFGWPLLAISVTEVLVLAWSYGSSNLAKDIEHMVGFRIGRGWQICWKVISPGLISVVLVWNIVRYKPVAYGDYVLPLWSQLLGWCVTLTPVVAVFVFAVVTLYASYSKPLFTNLTFWQSVKTLTYPSPQWKPACDGKCEKYKLCNKLSDIHLLEDTNNAHALKEMTSHKA